MNRGGFSWNRFLGVSACKRRVGRAVGVPWSQSGRNQAVGRAVTRHIWWLVLLMLGVTFSRCG